MKSSDHKFELNRMLLIQMGWKENNVNSFFSRFSEADVKYFIENKDNEYFTLETSGDQWLLCFRSKEAGIKFLCDINSNIELRKAIIKGELYSDYYKREMRLNKLLK